MSSYRPFYIYFFHDFKIQMGVILNLIDIQLNVAGCYHKDQLRVGFDLATSTVLFFVNA